MIKVCLREVAVRCSAPLHYCCSRSFALLQPLRFTAVTASNTAADIKTVLMTGQ